MSAEENAYDRQLRFEALPEPLRRQYNHDATVHIWVSAFLFSRVKREEMLEGLAAALANEKAAISENYRRYLAWFGSPPEKRPIT